MIEIPPRRRALLMANFITIHLFAAAVGVQHFGLVLGILSGLVLLGVIVWIITIVTFVLKPQRFQVAGFFIGLVTVLPFPTMWIVQQLYYAPFVQAGLCLSYAL